MKILADSSVWIDHLQVGLPLLAQRLEADEILCHPFVIGELACGSIRGRSQMLGWLSNLPQLEQAPYDEAMQMLEMRRLYSRGLGWVDIHLLAACLLSNAKLWTHDKPLRACAQELGIAA